MLWIPNHTPPALRYPRARIIIRGRLPTYQVIKNYPLTFIITQLTIIIQLFIQMHIHPHPPHINNNYCKVYANEVIARGDKS